VETPRLVTVTLNVVQASMEPRPHERGNVLKASGKLAAVVLQWSHVLTNVETGAQKRKAA